MNIEAWIIDELKKKEVVNDDHLIPLQLPIDESNEEIPKENTDEQNFLIYTLDLL